MTNKEAVWESIREELKRLRGRNLLRGREEHLFSQGLICLEIEQRGAGHAPQELFLRFSDSEQSIIAEHSTSQQKFHIREHDFDLRKFMEAMAEICRNKQPYLRTNSKIASYRTPDQD